MPKCPNCDKGAATCPQCKGSGRKGGGFISASVKCDNCNGSGKVKCGVCNGKGYR